MLRVRSNQGMRQRLAALPAALREAAQPFDLTVADQLGVSARTREHKQREADAQSRLARAEHLLHEAHQEDPHDRALTVTLTFVALAAKLAVCDGPLKREEYLALRSVFPLEGGVCHAVRRLFAQACADSGDAVHYAKLLAQLLPREELLRAQLLHMLSDMARADGPPNPRETALLWMTAAELGFTPGQAQKLLKSQAREKLDPRAVLGVKNDAPSHRIRNAYLRAIKRLHPDAVQHQALLPEGMEIAQRKAAALNEAYAALKPIPA